MSVLGWTEKHDPNWDFGMFILNQDIAEKTGWFGAITGSDSILQNYRVNVTGYPIDKVAATTRGLEMHTIADAIKRVEAEEFSYYIDTAGGQSGSGF